MKTLKLTLENSIDAKLQQQFGSVVRYSFCRMQEDESLKNKDIEKMVKKLNNIELLDSFLIQNAVMSARTKFSAYKEQLKEDPDTTVIFGGKRNFHLLSKKKISKEEYKENCLLPIYCQGDSSKHGNRKFKLDVKNNCIVFKYSRDHHIPLHFQCSGKNYRRQLEALQAMQDNNDSRLCYTVELGQDYISITFDETIFEVKHDEPVKGRVASIDMNPNYIAFVIQDADGGILLKELFDLKDLNDLDNKIKYSDKKNKSKWRSHLNNKRRHETIHIAKRMIETCIRYRVESFAIEDLNIKSSDKGKGKKYNKLCLNCWQRNFLFNNLSKRCHENGILFKPVGAWYSSVKGQVEHENDCDSIAAAIEIGTRIDKDMKHFGSTKVAYGSLSNRWKNEMVMHFKHTLCWKQFSEWLQKKFPQGSWRSSYNGGHPSEIVGFRFRSKHSCVKCHKMALDT